MQWNCQKAGVRLSFGISMLSCLFIQRISMRIERTYLSAPLFIVSVALLLLNDLYLKSAHPGLLTGKLSDIAGLFAFPFFFSLLLPRWKLPIYIMTAAGFILWKLPAADPVIAVINDILPYSIGRLADYSDYWALLVMPVAYIYKPQQVLWDNKAFQAAVASVAVFAFCATGGTHGFIKFYRYSTSKYQLQQYIDSVFTYYPDLKVPKDSPAYIDEWDPYFSCYLIDKNGPEIFTVHYYGDKKYWQEHQSSARIALIAAGPVDQVKRDKDLSSSERDRLIDKFETGFINKLNHYLTPRISSKYSSDDDDE